MPDYLCSPATEFTNTWETLLKQMIYFNAYYFSVCMADLFAVDCISMIRVRVFGRLCWNLILRFSALNKKSWLKFYQQPTNRVQNNQVLLCVSTAQLFSVVIRMWMKESTKLVLCVCVFVMLKVWESKSHVHTFCAACMPAGLTCKSGLANGSRHLF